MPDQRSQSNWGCSPGSRPIKGSSIGARPMLDATGIFEAHFLIGGASWCSADARLDRQSLSVLSQRSTSNKRSSASKLIFDRRSLLVLG